MGFMNHTGHTGHSSLNVVAIIRTLVPLVSSVLNEQIKVLHVPMGALPASARVCV